MTTRILREVLSVLNLSGDWYAQHAAEIIRDYLARGVPHQSGSETSKAAAEEIKPILPRLNQAVLAVFARTPNGMTGEEGQEAMYMNPSTYRPRRIELVDRGLVVDSGERRQTLRGRSAVVWKITEKGKENV